MSAHAGAHALKAGADVSLARVREAFAYVIADRSRFDAGTPAAFSFADRRADREQAIFVQDQVRVGPWTLNGGLRWDHYRLMEGDSAFSPRLAAAWSWPAADLVLRASYDRAFQESVETLAGDVLRLPVPPPRGDFYEAGSTRFERTGAVRTPPNLVEPCRTP